MGQDRGRWGLVGDRRKGSLERWSGGNSGQLRGTLPSVGHCPAESVHWPGLHPAAALWRKVTGARVDLGRVPYILLRSFRGNSASDLQTHKVAAHAKHREALIRLLEAQQSHRHCHRGPGSTRAAPSPLLMRKPRANDQPSGHSWL